MVKTTPPGRGSRLLRVVEDNPVYRRCVRSTVDGVRWSATGGFAESDLGCLLPLEQVGADLLACVGASRHVRAAEQGRAGPIAGLEPANRAVLDTMRETVDATARDGARFTRQAVQFHLRNAQAWSNDETGQDLAGQIDPEFVLGPALSVPTGG